MKRLLSVCALLWACSVVPSAYAMQDVAMPKFEHEVILNGNRPDAEKIVHDAIIEGAKKYDWKVVSDSHNTLRLKITVRDRHVAVIDVRIVDNSVAVDYVSSENMNYGKGGGAISEVCLVTPAASQCVKSRSGEYIHANYGRWVRNLLKSARIAAKTL